LKKGPNKGQRKLYFTSTDVIGIKAISTALKTLKTTKPEDLHILEDVRVKHQVEDLDINLEF